MHSTNLNVKDYIILAQSQIKKPYITAIVPIYNQETTGFLKDCLDSLVNQTFKNLEIICIDDHSKDSSLEVALDYANRHAFITVIHMKQNMRQGAARNRALDIARGEYISFVDSDDCLDPHYFEHFYKAASTFRCDAIESSFRYINEKGIPVGPIVQPHTTKAMETLNTKTIDNIIINHGMIWSYLFRSSLFADGLIRFPENTRYEDTPTLIHLISRLKTIGSCDKSIYYYRLNSTSTMAMTPNDPQAITDRINTAQLILEYTKHNTFYTQHKAALDYYYFKVCLLNTLYTISEGSLKYSRDSLTEIANTVKQNVPNLKDNYYIKQLPLYQRIASAIAIKSPFLYLKIRQFKKIATFSKQK